MGLVLARPAVTLLTRFAERFTTRAAEVKIDEPIFIFTLLISIGTGLLFGLAPIFSWKGQLSDALRQGMGRTTASRGRQRLRSGLVVAQVAVSFMLLAGAGLMIRSFVKLTKVDAGFSPDRLLTMRVTANFSHYKTLDQSIVLSHDILRRVGEGGAIQSVSLASNFPFNPRGVASGPGTTPFEIEGKPQSKGELAQIVDLTLVSSGYFETIRQPIVEGRDFNGHDDSKAPKVTIINQTMAHHRWPGEDAVGKRVKLQGDERWTKIIGIAGDTKEYGLNRPMSDEMYLPTDQYGFPGNLVVRTSADPLTLAPLIQKALRSVDPQLAIDEVATVKSLEQEWLASPRTITMLLGLFAALALAISAMGIAAVMALSVSQRRRELGIRLALGASQRSIVQMVVRNGLQLAVAGTIIGAAGALLLAPLISSLLYATGPNDAMAFAAVSLVFLTVAIVACFVPARQVTSIDPVIALRQE
jgi:predicted permease